MSATIQTGATRVTGTSLVADQIKVYPTYPADHSEQRVAIDLQHTYGARGYERIAYASMTRAAALELAAALIAEATR